MYLLCYTFEIYIFSLALLINIHHLLLEEMLQINVRGFKYEEEINKVEEE